jgi:hypothetical protein
MIRHKDILNLLKQGPSGSMTTIDNRVGGGTRRGGCNVLYCLDYRVVYFLYKLL